VGSSLRFCDIWAQVLSFGCGSPTHNGATPKNPRTIAFGVSWCFDAQEICSSREAFQLKGEFIVAKVESLRANIAKVGGWAFIAGIVLAVVAGLFLEVPGGNFTWVLAFLGLVVGLLNVYTREPQGFLLAAIALTLSASALQSLPLVGGSLTHSLSNVVTFIAAAMLVAAVKILIETARGQTAERTGDMAAR
jgi:hypothetical protein